jgi:hypothetical protein
MKPARAAARQAIALEDVVERLAVLEQKIDRLLEAANLELEPEMIEPVSANGKGIKHENKKS